MATRNYKLKLKEKTEESKYDIMNAYPAYYKFAREFNENNIKNGIETYFIHEGIDFYEIKNTSVICSRKDNFCVESKTEDVSKYNYGNLRITGLADNIKQAEDEIKSKGFVLAKLDDR
jgi:hypothetical protein